MIRQLDLMGIWVLNTSGHYHLWPGLYIKPIYHSVCTCCFILQTALSPGQSEGITFCIFTIWTACLVLNALILSTFFFTFSYFYEYFCIEIDIKLKWSFSQPTPTILKLGSLLPAFPLLIQFMHLKFTFIYNNFSFVNTLIHRHNLYLSFLN